LSGPSVDARLAGGVWGHLVGDAIGVPYEFRRPDEIRRVVWGTRGTHGQPAGTWSDDGAMMLATLDSLLSVGFDPQDQGQRFLRWFDRGEYTPDHDGKFDYGGTTAHAMNHLRRGTAARDAGGRTEHDNGNGSLMRILPIALVGRALAPDELIEQAHEASRITHAHPWAQATCALYVLIAQALLKGASPVDALAGSASMLRSRYEDADADPTRAPALARVLAHAGREGRGFVVDSFWSAWEAFAGAESYHATITRAVQYGHDTDTTACIAGGLAGIAWGVQGIPAQWREAMRGRAIVDPLIVRLLAGRTKRAG
jgi:ADP-ribosylglycohydrolase